MATFVLTVFLLTFGAMLAYTFRKPAMAIPLGIMTYGYKQVASLALPMLQSQGALLNYAMAGMIAMVFMYNLFFRNPGVTCRTASGKAIQLAVWIFLLYFWVTLLWSPYYGSDPMKFVPYLLVYFAMLPALMDTPVPMLRAFHGCWFLTILAVLGLMASPAFHLSPDLGRMTVHFEAGRVNEASPLAIADMGALLIIMSVMVLLPQDSFPRDSKLFRAARKTLAVAGIGLGLWLAFNTSRGETMTGLACGCLLFALVKGKTTSQSLTWLVGAGVGLLLTLAMVFTLVPKGGLSESAERYSPSAIAEGKDDRVGLSSHAIEMGLSSTKSFIFGKGARACEKELGMWPHNHFVQAFGEAGIIGLGLLIICCLMTLRFGFQTLALVRKSGDSSALLFTALALSLLIYQIIVLSKKGSLTFTDTYMWLSIGAFSFDRTQIWLLYTAREKASQPA